MAQAKEVSRESAISVLDRLFRGRSLSGFHLLTNFRLHFEPVSDSRFAGDDAPSELIVESLAGPWINGKDQWDEKVSNVPSSTVEQSDPVLAYELARLRWTADTEVADVSGDEFELVFSLKNGETITFPQLSEDEFAFLATDNPDETRSKLSVCCVDGIFYIKGAEFLLDIE